MYIDSIRTTIRDEADLNDEIDRIKKIVGHPITIFYNPNENTAIMLYFNKAIYVGEDKSEVHNQVRYAWWYKLEEMYR